MEFSEINLKTCERKMSVLSVQPCSFAGNIKCNVEESLECIRGVVETGFQMSTNQGSDGDKALVCRLIIMSLMLDYV